jgi:F-type H+-transporting ATPase subunit b
MLFVILESNLLAVEPGLVVWSAITFLLLLLVLRKFAWKPILSAIENRETHIRESIERAEEAQRKADENLKSYQKIMEDARKESREILEKGRMTAETMREEILDKAKEESARMVEKAKKEISLEREKSLDEIRRLAVDLSLAAASKLVERSLKDSDHEKIVEQYIKEMKVS